MKRRAFTQTSAAIMTGTLLSPLASFGQEARRNWAGNYTYSTSNLFSPASVGEVQEILGKTSKIKTLGTRHSFNGVADSTENQISLKRLDQISLNRTHQEVTVEAGVRYGELGQFLEQEGFAVHNLASLPHISVVGACATATHGSGVGNGNLATAVKGLEMVTADGEVVSISSSHGDPFYGSVVALGALGAVTKVTLAVQPSFQVTQEVYLDLPMEELKEHFDDIMSAGYSVSLFTNWQKPSVNQVWIKRRPDGHDGELESEFYGATRADRDVHPIIEISAENCTPQMAKPGPWHERLPHFRLNFTPSSGEELQAEYFVPAENAVEAMLAIQRMGKEIGPHLFISEIRTIAADELWMSPCYRQDCVSLHFTWKPDWPAVSTLLPKIEKELDPFGVKPHWGKLFTLAPAKLQSRYAKLDDFKGLMKEYDPKGKFVNRFIEGNLMGS